MIEEEADGREIILVATIRANPDKAPRHISVEIDADPRLTPRNIGDLLRAVAADHDKTYGASVISHRRLVTFASRKLIGSMRKKGSRGPDIPPPRHPSQ